VPAPSPEAKTRASSTSASVAASLASLARRDARFQYDAKAQAARVDLPIAFDEKTATLTAADKLKLDELAKVLKSDDARELRVVVAGQQNSAGETGNARAQAVADYLDRHGIAGKRLAVSRGSSGAASSSGVQIYLVDPASPVANWESHEQPVRR
jgi:outer membrane protein OmpA-like peptidoglycan-associated protein